MKRIAISRQRVIGMALIFAVSRWLRATAEMTRRAARFVPPAKRRHLRHSFNRSLPEITNVKQAGGQAIAAPTSADWVLVDFGRAWVSGMGKGVAFFDAETGRFQGSAPVPQSPCAGMASGFGAVGPRHVTSVGSLASTRRAARSPVGWRSTCRRTASRASV
jgi:hypothetical protein